MLALQDEAVPFVAAGTHCPRLIPGSKFRPPDFEQYMDVIGHHRIAQHLDLKWIVFSQSVDGLLCDFSQWCGREHAAMD